jgi:hypothetical protein
MQGPSVYIGDLNKAYLLKEIFNSSREIAPGLSSCSSMGISLAYAVLEPLTSETTRLGGERHFLSPRFQSKIDDLIFGLWQFDLLDSRILAVNLYGDFLHTRRRDNFYGQGTTENLLAKLRQMGHSKKSLCPL